jgi:hypothetical protein
MEAGCIFIVCMRVLWRERKPGWHERVAMML